MTRYVRVRTPVGVFLTRLEAERGDLLVVRMLQSSVGRHDPEIGTPVEVTSETPGQQLWSGGVVTDVGAEGRLTIRVLRTGAESRRRHVRAPVGIELAVFPPGSAEPVPGTCVDVSEGGMQAILPLELEVGDSVRVILSVSDGSSAETTARVVRRVGERRYGLEFELSLRGARSRIVAAALKQAARADRPLPG